MISIRQAEPDDDAGIWTILEPMIRAGETYALPRSLLREEALAYWRGSGNTAFVAEEDRVSVGTYMLRKSAGRRLACQQLRLYDRAICIGSRRGRRHVPRFPGAGRRCRFLAMQFNFVVSANERAVNLWKRHGFEIVGRLPAAFLHPTLGYVDVFVMFRAL